MARHDEQAIRTADGWSLPLHRIVPSRRRWPTPVLLLHGLTANGYCMWHEPGPSLGGYLVDEGFEVWVLEFRGTRRSSHPAGRPAEAIIRVEDKVNQDLRGAIEAVLDQGNRQLDVVGHSLGGTILFAYLSRFPRAPLRRCVTISAALRYELPAAARLAHQVSRSRFGRALLPRQLPARRFTQLGALTNVVYPARDHFNLANMDRRELRRMMRHGTEDIPMSELLELAGWTRGNSSIAQRLGGVRQPLLLVGGVVDRHTAVRDLEAVLAAWGGEDKALMMVGQKAGARRDYGHTDLLLGPRASTEVFPHIAAWLRRGGPSSGGTAPAGAEG